MLLYLYLLIFLFYFWEPFLEYNRRRSELIVKSFSNATAGLYECRAKNMVMVNHSRKVEKKTIRIEAYGRPGKYASNTLCY